MSNDKKIEHDEKAIEKDAGRDIQAEVSSVSLDSE